MMQIISVARDFTPFPGGRYRRHGKGSGQEFREDVLVPILRSGGNAVIDLDGASGYPPSFLDEAFGGLVREGFSPDEIKSHIELRAGPGFSMYINMIWSYIEKESSRQHATTAH
jgi:hypothetical protein